MQSNIFRSSIWLVLQTASARLTLVLAVFCMFAGSAQATNYISWNADGITGANRPWCPTESRACWDGEILYENTIIDTSVKHSGAASMKMTVNGIGSNEPAGLHIPAMYGHPPDFPFNVAGSQLYYRWWMRIGSGFSWGDGDQSKTKANRIIRSDYGMAYYTGYVFHDGFRIAECAADAHCLDNQGNLGTDGGNIYVPFNMNNMADNQWHEYIVRIKANTSTSCTTPGTCNAEFEVYVDGSSVGSYSNFRLTDNSSSFFEAWGGWMINPYWQMGSSYSAGGSIWVDDVSTDDTWNSTFGGGDTTAPAAPTGLGVQ